MLGLQQAYDRFVDVNPDGTQAPTYMYLAAEIPQRWHHFDDAERRFTRVLEAHCNTNVAINAGKAVIDGWVARENLQKTREWTEKLMGMGCGEGDAGKVFTGELKSLKNAVRFQEATLLYDAGEFEAAADRYVALVSEAPDDPNADRALNNAAVAYEKIGRYGSASQTYRRIYTSYPTSEFADDALLRTGFNHIRFFEFDDAIAAYLVLAEDKRYQDSEFRETALWNAADLADNLQDYQKSASLYRKFAERSKDPAKIAEATFRAAEVVAKTGNAKATISAFESYLRNHGSDPAEAARSLEARLRIGHAWNGSGNRQRAEKYYADVVGTFAARGMEPATDPAGLAAEAQFQLAEFVMGDYLRVRLKSTGKKLESETKDLLEKMVAAAKAYTDVVRYRRADWALAAVFRTGYAFEQTAIKLREAPVPSQLKQYSEAWFAYKDIVDKAAQQFEDKAIDFYAQTLTRAQEYGIANEWTRAATERLNVYRPEEYPLLRPPALGLQLEDRR
jgi:tetratricopeptide (TPR) repeat protein